MKTFWGAITHKKIKLLYLNGTFYPAYLIYSAIIIPLLLLFVAGVRPFTSKRYAMKRFRRAISWYGLIVIYILPFPLVRVKYIDYEKGRREGPLLFICNHRSTSDPYLAACFPYEIIQVVNIWPFRIPVLGYMAKAADYLSIREMTIDEFYHAGEKLFSEGVSMLAFPEGTRSGSRKMGPFHGATFRLALRTRVPLVPVCITGNENIPRKGSLLLNPGSIKIHALPSLEWDDYKDLTSLQLKRKVWALLADKMTEIEGKP